jgi:hypothetical protein
VVSGWWLVGGWLVVGWWLVGGWLVVGWWSSSNAYTGVNRSLAKIKITPPQPSLKRRGSKISSFRGALGFPLGLGGLRQVINAEIGG